jgi:orotate phosphoribosyltransferase
MTSRIPVIYSRVRERREVTAASASYPRVDARDAKGVTMLPIKTLVVAGVLAVGSLASPPATADADRPPNDRARVRETCQVPVRPDVAALIPTRGGHFVVESGHHSPAWIDLERLFLRPATIRPFAVELSGRLERHEIDVVCGPLVEGAFVALAVAEHLAVPFTYAERFEEGEPGSLFPVRYRLPAALRDVVVGRRVAIVNDVVSAGSAVKGTHADLVEHGANPVVIATLAVLGDSAARFAAESGIELDALHRAEATIWEPAACPLCWQGVPIDAPST